MSLKAVLTNVIIIIAILVLIVLYFMIQPTMQGSFDAADPCVQEGQICSVVQPTGAYVEHPSSFCEVEEEKCWVEVGD